MTIKHQRIVSGMRPTGKLHLGHYHGVIKEWQKLQQEYECFFFIADWHALTTHYENTKDIQADIWEMTIDWLACGINPNFAKIFVQSKVLEQAELHILLSMITPLSWLERVPTYREQQEKLKEKDLATYGFLGYPLLQSADILAYKANWVPVGEDQLPHVELTREVARRFNHLYGLEPDFAIKAEAAMAKMGKKNAGLYKKLRKQYQELGNQESLETGKALLENQQNITLGDKERLYGYLEGTGRIILPEPQVLLSETPKVTGIDGQKMSKSYHNTIGLREDPESVAQKIRTMPTDPARVRRTDPGEPEKCPVWSLHTLYSNAEVKDWVQKGCRSAGIGCLECKQPVIEAIQKEQQPILERAAYYQDNPNLVKKILADGCETARCEAKKTLEEVRQAIGLS